MLSGVVYLDALRDAAISYRSFSYVLNGMDRHFGTPWNTGKNLQDTFSGILKLQLPNSVSLSDASVCALSVLKKDAIGFSGNLMRAFLSGMSEVFRNEYTADGAVCVQALMFGYKAVQNFVPCPSQSKVVSVVNSAVQEAKTAPGRTSLSVFYKAYEGAVLELSRINPSCISGNPLCADAGAFGFLLLIRSFTERMGTPCSIIAESLKSSDI